MGVKELVEKYKYYVIEQRREFHKYPEPSFKEFETSKKIKAELDKMHIPYISAAGTGIIATIQGENPGKTIALRADMDALSVNEMNTHEYKSQVEGMMHACGHDGHTSMLLGAAKVLNELKGEINGTVKLFFQPAEEIGQGANAMIKEGALNNVDGIFGIHLWSDIEVGKISVDEGPRMAATDVFKIKVKGKGGHGSAPHQCVDAVVASSAIVMNLQSIVSREVHPSDPLVISVGTLNSGTRFNVIAEEGYMEGSVRMFNPELRKKVPGMMERVIKSTAATYRAEAEFTYDFVLSPTINDATCSKIAESTVETLYGKDTLIKFEKLNCGEDLGHYMEKVPGILALVGCRNEAKGIDKPHHSCYFDIDEKSLEIGTGLYVQYALDFLNKF